jgi:biotin operon repressor
VTTRSTIEALLRSEPMTGAQIRKHVGGTSTAVHRYLHELRRRGVIVGARDWSGRILYAIPGQPPAQPAIALNWKRAA